MRSRYLAVPVLCLAGSALVSGCGPDVEQQVGLTRSSSGELVAVVAGCGEDVDGLVLIDVTQEADSYEPIGVWQHDGPVEGTASWALAGGRGRSDWSATVPWDGQVEPGRAYVLQAGLLAGTELRLDEPVSSFLRFTAPDVAGLTAGHLLLRTEDGSPSEVAVRTGTVAGFADLACD